MMHIRGQKEVIFKKGRVTNFIDGTRCYNYRKCGVTLKKGGDVFVPLTAMVILCPRCYKQLTLELFRKGVIAKVI